MRLSAAARCKQNPGAYSTPLPRPAPRPLRRRLRRLGCRFRRPPPLGCVLLRRRLEEVLAADAEGLGQGHDIGPALLANVGLPPDDQNDLPPRPTQPCSLGSKNWFLNCRPACVGCVVEGGEIG